MGKKKLLEAALFMSPKPLTLNDLAKITKVNSLGYVKNLLEELANEYSGSGLEISNNPQGWYMQVRQEVLPEVAHLTPYSDLSEGCKRTLAIVLYKEPVKQSEIIKMQGNKAYAYIKTLARKGLLSAEKEGRTKILKLTKEFERYFGERRDKIREELISKLREQKEKPAAEEPEAEADS